MAKKILLALLIASCFHSTTAMARLLAIDEFDNGKLYDGLVPSPTWPYFVPGAVRYHAQADASGTIGYTFIAGGPGGPKYRTDTAYLVFDLSQLDFQVASAALRLNLGGTDYYIEEDEIFADVLDFSTTTAQELWALPTTGYLSGPDYDLVEQIIRAPILDSVQLIGGSNEFTVSFGGAAIQQINASDGYLVFGLNSSLYNYERLIENNYRLAGTSQLLLSDGSTAIPTPRTLWLLCLGILAFASSRTRKNHVLASTSNAT